MIVKDRHKARASTTELPTLLTTVNPAIAELVIKQAGDKLNVVLQHTETLMGQGKNTERALADALEKYKLV